MRKKKGHALVELVLCMWMGVFFVSGTAFLRHTFRLRSTALALCSLGADLAAHPDISHSDRKAILLEAAKPLLTCSECKMIVFSQRNLRSSSARFYDFVETIIRVQVGHSRLRRMLGLGNEFISSSSVIKEPSHAAA